MSHRYLSFIQVTSYLTSKQRLLFGTSCFHQRPKLTTRRPKTAVVVRYFTLCSSQGTNSYDDDGSSDNDLRNNVSVMVPKPLTIPLQDDTQLTFMFSYADMLQLVEKLNQLVLSFRQAAEAVAQRKKHEVQPVFEYYCQRDGLFIHMECNPNLFTSAFQAQVYIRVYDDKLRVHSQASLTSLMDVLRKWKAEYASFHVAS
jgi:hypothetical protein